MIPAWFRRRAERKAQREREREAMEAALRNKRVELDKLRALSVSAWPPGGNGVYRASNDDGGASAFLFAAGIASSSYDPGCSPSPSTDSGSSCSSSDPGGW